MACSRGDSPRATLSSLKTSLDSKQSIDFHPSAFYGCGFTQSPGSREGFYDSSVSDLDLDPFGRVVPLLPAGDLPENPGKEVRRGLFPGYCGCQSIGVSVSAEGAEGV